MKTIVIDGRKIQSSTGRYIEELISHLDDIDRDHRYILVVYPEEMNHYQPKHDNVSVVATDFRHYTFGEQIGFNHFLRSLKPDLVHFYMPQQPLLYTRPSITTVHDLNLVRVTANDMNPVELVIKRTIFQHFLKIVARRSKHIITPTQYTKDDLVQYASISPNKVTVTYEGVIKLGEYEPVPKYKDKKFLVYLGRAEPYKNNRRMIEAHQRLLTLYPDLRLVIIGAIDELRQADMQWVRDNKYKNVDFAGFLSDEQAAWLYQHCQAFVQPSMMEGFGLPVLEAMAQGAPIVCSNATCCPEVYGDAAHYFDPTSVDDIERAINDVLVDEKLRKKLIEHGARQIKKYSWLRMAEQTLQIYKRLLVE